MIEEKGKSSDRIKADRENMPAGSGRFWAQYPGTYRADEMGIMADWIAAGESGVVVGLAGVGRATLLGFLCHRPDALQSYSACHGKTAVLIPVDLNNLPDNRLATLYRVMLRSFYEARQQFDPSLQQHVHDLYRAREASRDPFLSQSALRELLLLFQDQEMRVVLVMNRFDRFCQMATLQMTKTLRGLRDGFKDTLCYIMGMRQDVVYLTDLDSIGPLRGILDTQVCWVGPLNEADARHMIAHETGHLSSPVPERDVARLLALTGGYPSLIRVACHWWISAGMGTAVSDWTNALLTKQNMQHRLGEIWSGLTQEEQLLLFEIHKLQIRLTTQEKDGDGENFKRIFQGLEKQHSRLLNRLVVKGVCRKGEMGWRIVGDLVTAYVATAAGRSRGKIWLDEEMEDVYQGSTLIGKLKPLERSVLHFLIDHPRERHTHSDLIEAAWPDDVHREGVSTEALYQTIRGIRKKIEPNTAEPCYVINWRGQPEGGYQFFAEGRPRG